VKPAYKREHQPDELGQHLSAATSDDKGRVDVEKLQKLAEQHGVWDPRYARLNPGLVRMSVGNRLRAKVRKGAEIVWPA
jgi:hypothetical protein